MGCIRKKELERWVSMPQVSVAVAEQFIDSAYEDGYQRGREETLALLRRAAQITPKWPIADLIVIVERGALDTADADATQEG